MKKLLRILSVKPMKGFQVKVHLTDGTARVLDLAPFLHGPVFEEIKKNLGLFRGVKVEHGTLAWPNGADLCPDVLLGAEVARRVVQSGRTPKKKCCPHKQYGNGGK